MAFGSVEVNNSPLTNYNVSGDIVGGAIISHGKLLNPTEGSTDPIGITGMPIAVAEDLQSASAPTIGSEMAGASVSGTAATLITLPAGTRKLHIINTLNFEIYIRYDNSASTFQRLPQKTDLLIDFAASGLTYSDVVEIKYVSSPGSPTGWIQATAWGT